MTLFSSLGLAEPILRAVREKGYETATPIQAQAIPVVLSGRDVLAAAQTGTGKTAGFTLPMLQRLADRPPPAAGRPVRALVLTPTRELAAQVAESVDTYGKHLPLRSTVVFGGVGINPQIDRLRRGVDILIATPGRLLDLHGQRALDLGRLEVLVLDEADRMLDMGFIHDIRRILKLLPAQRQNLLFSATFSDDIRQLANGILNNPASVEVAARNTTATTVTQSVYAVEKLDKADLLAHLIHRGGWEQVLVFTRTKHGANRLAEKLLREGITAAAIHGNKSQGARTKALADFKQGAVRALVATDIAARGLDIEQLPQVVNFELPNVPEDYVHRIGRTGRAGCPGAAISLVSQDERKLLADIERLLKRKLTLEPVPSFERGVSAPVDISVDDRPPLHQQRRGGGRGQPPRGDAPRAHGNGASGNRAANGNQAPSRNRADGGQRAGAAGGAQPAGAPRRRRRRRAPATA